jgi:hypothetical protein
MSIINPDLWYKIKGKSTKIESKFKYADTRSRRQKLKDFGQSLLFWKGRSKGMIHTRDLEWDDLRYIFFPTKGDRYGYLGITFYNDSEFNKVLLPLVLAMDYEAKPWWCPRWFLRFLHVFGNDKSIVRVRNWTLSNLHRKLTKGIQFWDWKTKWSHYDLRISISAPKHLQDLASWIESGFYKKGYQNELIERIKKIDPNANTNIISVDYLEKQLEELEEKLDNKEQ